MELAAGAETYVNYHGGFRVYRAKLIMRGTFLGLLIIKKLIVLGLHWGPYFGKLPDAGPYTVPNFSLNLFYVASLRLAVGHLGRYEKVGSCFCGG